VERCLACEAVVSRELRGLTHRHGSARFSARYAFIPSNGFKGCSGASPPYQASHHGLVSEAVLHGFASLAAPQHGPDCANGQAGRVDVVYPEYGGSPLNTGDNAGEGSGITVFRVR
jgi:hypothetical protein